MSGLLDRIIIIIVVGSMFKYYRSSLYIVLICICCLQISCTKNTYIPEELIREAKWMTYAYSYELKAKAYKPGENFAKIYVSPLECKLELFSINNLKPDSISITFEWLYEEKNMRVETYPYNVYGVVFIKARPAYALISKTEIVAESRENALDKGNKVSIAFQQYLSSSQIKLNSWLVDECVRRGIK